MSNLSSRVKSGDPSLAMRVRFLLLSFALGAGLLATAGAQTVVLHDLPSGGDEIDECATALDIMPGLLNVGGVAKIRLWYSNTGTNIEKAGQFRAFDILSPLPPLGGPLPLFIDFQDPVVGFNQNHAKRPTLKSVHTNRGLAVCLISTIWKPGGTPAGTGTEGGRVVSFVNPIASSFNPMTGDQPTDLLLPTISGRAPEGAASFKTFVGGQRHRFVVANNYHEGSVTFFNWDDVTAPTAFREVRVNTDLSTCFPLLAEFPDGNHNRGIAVAQPTLGPFAGQTVVLIGMNFDPYGVDCDNDLDGDMSADEGENDYLVVLDVTTMDPAVHVDPPRTNVILGPADQCTVSAVTVHPNQHIVYVVSMFQQGNSPGEQPYIYTIDLTKDLGQMVVQSTPLRALSPGPPVVPASMDNFFSSPGHCPFVSNSNLAGLVKDRLYIPSFKSPDDGVYDGSVLVLDVTTPFELDPQFLKHIIISDPSGPAEPNWNVYDLVAAPVSPDFLGGPADMDRNVLFGILKDLSGATAGLYGKLLILEDQ